MSAFPVHRVLQPQILEPQDIWNWYQAQRRIVSGERVRTRSSPGTRQHSHDSPYFGLTEAEIEDYFDQQIEELELLTMLGLISVTEGCLHRDFRARTSQRLKDKISKRFRRIQKKCNKKNRRIELEGHILPVWREHSDDRDKSRAINGFCSLLPLRHWLAHGRHWNAKLGRDYDTQDVYVTCSSVLTALGL